MITLDLLKIFNGFAMFTSICDFLASYFHRCSHPRSRQTPHRRGQSSEDAIRPFSLLLLPLLRDGQVSAFLRTTMGANAARGISAFIAIERPGDNCHNINEARGAAQTHNARSNKTLNRTRGNRLVFFIHHSGLPRRLAFRYAGARE